MTDDRPDPGTSREPLDPSTASTDPLSADDEGSGPDASVDEDLAAGEDVAADTADEDVAADSADEEVTGGAGAAAVGAGVAAAAPAWTTTPVAPDPEATEAALAALAARPEVPPEPPAPPPTAGFEEEPSEEGTPVLLVGGILIGAFIVALAIVFILFRPFDSGSVVDVSPAPSPVVTASPSASPSAETSVDTPNFQGLSLEEAEQTAADYGLVIRANPVETDEVEPGTILGQEPGPGVAVVAGSTVELQVAVAPASVAVPDIVDVPEDDAITAIEDAGLVAGTRTQASHASIVAGNVISSIPAAAAEVLPGSAVSYVVSTGPGRVAVPDIVDVPEIQALSSLTTAGLVAGTRTQASHASIVAGNVISSIPAAATEVLPGSAVSYVVSTGPARVAVPDIVDVPEIQALSSLTTAGLVAGTRTQASHASIVAGNVISSIPAAATEVLPGSAVSYVVSTGPGRVAVPDVVGLPEAQSVLAVRAAGLVPGSRTVASHPTIVAGSVISTNPAAATEVLPGSAVAYVVSTGPARVAVPDIEDVPETEALSTLRTAGVVPGARSQAFHPTIVAGNVISSVPAAGTLVPVGSAVGYVVSLGVEEVAVPDLSGPAADAAAALEAARLTGSPSEAYSDSVPAGEVVSQDPPAESLVPVGSAVGYVVSLGVEEVAVPDLSGPAADAAAALEAARLTGSPSEAYSDSVPAGEVVSQDPPAESLVPVGSAVGYVVSLGVEEVAVPDLSGPAADAAAALEAARLTGSPSEAYSDSVPAGEVVSQDPPAESLVPVGSAVGYVVSLGVEEVAVPDLSGPAADAAAALEAARLTGSPSEAYSDSVPAGEVVSQDPPAESLVPVGSAVGYVVSLGVEEVAVPDLSGPAADAAAALEAARLTGSPSEAYSDSVPAGEVVSQDPPAESLVPVGSAVGYVVSLGVEEVAVPDLSGPAADAAAALEAARLTGSPSEAYSDSVPAGEVVSQDPPAESLVPVGSAVGYVVSLGVEEVAVPDLSGPAADAAAALEAARLTGSPSEAYSDSVPAGEVVSQDPPAESLVPVGSAVGYVVSLGVEEVAVPDLSGPAADAAAALEAARLTGSPSEAYSDSVPAGEVVSQDPPAESLVPVGSAVGYVVSLGVEEVAVPDLSGPAADAAAALEAARLTGSPSEAYSDSVPAGEVVSQDPPAESLVPVGSAVGYVVSLGVEEVAVPDLSGPAADAAAALEAARLTGSPSEAYSDSVPAGEVVSQDPPAESLVPVGSAVGYVVSLGVEEVAVPDLSGPAADAAAALEAARLTGSPSEAYSDSVPAGEVVSQDPPAESLVPVGSAVGYVVSLGVEEVAVPDLSGPAADAAAALEAARLTGSPSEAYSDSVPAGEVVSQDPPAESLVPVGSAVGYVVSLGVEEVAVPDLSGPAADAAAALEAARLTGSPSEAYSDSVPAGEVVSQDPPAESLVPVGSAVGYVVSLGVEEVAVPDLSGPAADAAAALEAARLTGSPSEAYSDSVPAGEVVSQDPPAESLVPVGSAVGYVVSLGVEEVAVPDLSGPAADAAAALEAARLTGSPSEAYSDSVPAGEVVSQDPPAESLVPVGSAVGYVVSLGVSPTVTVPPVRDLPETEAISAVQGAGLAVGETVEQSHEKIDAGNAIRTDPVTDAEVDAGTSVILYVSTGSGLTAVPEVNGLPEADAVAAITTAGLVVGATDPRSNANVAAGLAVKTDPPVGTEVALGSSVTLIVSTGLKPVAVPAIVGLLQRDARAAIEAAGLVVGASSVVEDPSPANTVLSQAPEAGIEVPTGSAVDYTVSSGPPVTAVPEVNGLPEADAVAAITTAGLVVGATDPRSNANVAAGLAVKTDPPVGTEVALGSSVTLIVSTGLKPVAVPAIVGLLQRDARAAIEAAGLVVGASSVVEDPSPANTVLSQAPEAGIEVPTGSAVDYTVSSGPPVTAVPEVNGLPEADAVAAITTAGLVVGATDPRSNANVAAGLAVKTDPPVGTEVALGSSVTLIVSTGLKPVAVPAIVGLAEADALAALTAAEVVPGTRSEANDPAPAGIVIGQDPPAGTTVFKDSPVAYVVSLGPTAPPLGAGGTLTNPAVASQLDVAGAGIPTARELPLGGTPYDATAGADQRAVLSARSGFIHDPARIADEQQALRRLGLLAEGQDLAGLLNQLYGQDLPVAYLEQNGHLSVIANIESLNGAQQAMAAREFGRAAVNQNLGLGQARVGDLSQGDRAIAGVAMEQGDGTSTMLGWAAANAADQGPVEGAIVPGDDGLLASMPPILQREYDFPFLEGRLFVDRLKENGGWNVVNGAWASPPASTEQILHPAKYPAEGPFPVALDGLAGRLGGAWAESWQQTMGELRIGVWLADGQPGTQQGPRAPIDLPRANAAAGWGGDRLVSLNNGDGTWAIIWQTTWDSPDDVTQFTDAASAALADLPGAHAVLPVDIVGGMLAPALVLVTSDPGTLAGIQAALGIG